MKITIQTLLELGCTFNPSDSEACTFLLKFLAGHDMCDSGFITRNVDVYGNEEPLEIYSRGVPCWGRDEDEDDDGFTSFRYFMTKLKPKKDGGKMYQRGVGKGSWKQQNKGDKVLKYEHSGPVIGQKKSFVYEGTKNDDGHWLMKEFELSKPITTTICNKFKDPELRHWVLCAIKKNPQISTSTVSSDLVCVDSGVPSINSGVQSQSSQMEQFLMSPESTSNQMLAAQLEQFLMSPESTSTLDNHMWEQFLMSSESTSNQMLAAQLEQFLMFPSPSVH